MKLSTKKAFDFIRGIAVNQIDQLVYELYGLTDEEIKIVEKSEGPVTNRR